MSTLDLEEQEQLAALKAGWQRYGNLLVGLLTLALLAFAAWNGWQWYQRSQSVQAASFYESLQKAARANDVKAARDSAGAILEQFPRTAYAPLAALVAAKVNFQAGDLKTAQIQLQWAIDNARSDELKSIARLRLAAVLVDQGSLDVALKVIDIKAASGFESLYGSMRGDLLLAQKRIPEAKAAYMAALGQVDKRDRALRDHIQLKLDALGA